MLTHARLGGRNGVQKIGYGLSLLLLLLACVMGFSVSGFGQAETASLSGAVMDPSGAVVVDAEVQVTNVDTNISTVTRSNRAGVYVVASLQPGRYRVIVTKQGFKQIALTDVVLNVQDTVSRNFTLELGATSESITVNGSGVNINTTDAAVSTVVDQQFVANIPLNGRSLQSLISLTPGVLLVPGGAVGGQGEFSVNGQRTEANYFTVDGVSSNTGSNPRLFGTPGTGGNVASETALGTTQSMISLDALQEFRATTSTYSAEYGRTPGGQFSFVSRGGTNDWHGSAFDYFRNEALDANNWFSDALGIRKTPERQNDFGGTLGGPVRIPGLYNGKDKTFFFFSYEGLRLQLPAGRVTDQYPDIALRQNAPAVLQPFLNAFPIPNGPEVIGPCDPATDPTCPPSGQKPIGLALFTAAYSNPDSLDAISIRVDHNLSGSIKFFGRYSGSPSSSTVRDAGADLASSAIASVNVKTLTLGATNALSPRLNNDFRFNYTRNDGTINSTLDNFGGAQPFKISQTPGFGGASAPRFAQVAFDLTFGPGPNVGIFVQQNAQRQWNLTDAFAVSRGSHNLKFGIDYRRVSTYVHVVQLGEAGVFSSNNELLNNAPDHIFAFSAALVPPRPIYTNFSAYVEDEWKATHSLSLSFGLRWDVNPPPGNSNGILPYTLNEITDLSTAHLAPKNTPLWRTAYHAFGPRLGAAYTLRQSAGAETVVRGGFGLFYDMGNAFASAGFNGVGFGTHLNCPSLICPSGPFPLTSDQLNKIPPPSIIPPYDNTVNAFDPHLKLPYTMQWNVAVEQAMGLNQALTLTYVGSAGRRLSFTSQLFPPTNPNFASGNGLYLTTGRASSDYDALQVQFQKRLTHGLQALASYTWSHSIDDGSNNFFIDRLVRGSSDFDVRHNFQMALTYDVPGNYSNPIVSAILKHWGLDTRVSARSALPVDVSSCCTVLPNGQSVNLRPDLVPGVPIYLFGSQYPGGRILNFNAFQPAPNNTQGDLPRNFARDFHAVQADLALRRDFPITERLHFQFRAEAFNLLNHPNFSQIDNNLGDGPYQTATLSGFGGAGKTLNNTLGGLNPLYQVGGPRSLQLALKLLF
jgi:outer membrane receptor protein involved in Fe transport